jgi:hypothetical protein
VPDGKCIFLEDRRGAYRHEWMVKAALDRIYAKLDDYEGSNLDRQHALGQLALGQLALGQLALLCHFGEKALR